MSKLNFAHILNATYNAIDTGADTHAAAKAAYPMLTQASATVATLLALDRDAQDTRAALGAADVSIAAGLRSILVSNGVDVSAKRSVSAAIVADVWLDSAKDRASIAAEAKEAGITVRPASKAELTEAALTYYNKVQQRVNRLALAIVGAPKVAPDKAKVRVAKAVQTSIDALLAEHGAAVLREALKRAIAAAK